MFFALSFDLSHNFKLFVQPLVKFIINTLTFVISLKLIMRLNGDSIKKINKLLFDHLIQDTNREFVSFLNFMDVANGTKKVLILSLKTLIFLFSILKST